jgi:zinc protease
MKRILAILFCLAFLSIPAIAQETQPQKPEPKAPEAKVPEAKAPEAKAPEAKETEPLPSVDQILDKLIESSGGKAAIEKITSRQVKGTFEVPAMSASGSWQQFAKAPNKIAMIIDVPNFGVIQQAYDGKVAWENNPMAGMRELAGAELAARKRDAEFYRETKLKELYKTLTVKGKRKVGEKDAYIVEAVPAEGSAEKMYFDVETGLLVRTDAEREGPEGMVSVETYLENYKEVDGIKMPFTIRQVMPNMAILVKFDEVKHNIEIDDAKFAKPATP